MTNRVRPGELAPVEDRIRWMLLFRAALGLAVLVAWQTADAARGPGAVWLVAVLGWPALTALSLLAARIGRRSARAALTMSLLIDGVLLGAAWWATGTFHGVLGYLVLLHAVAVTLLASFRTGVKLAVWHTVVALQFLEATAAGLLGKAEPVPLLLLWLHLGALWLAVVGTASFAAANERELRRRRYDSEVLRLFGLSVVTAPNPAAVVVELAGFARGELSVRRAVSLVRVRGDGDGDAQTLAVVLDRARGGQCDRARAIAEAALRPGTVVADALARAATVLTRRLDPGEDPWLAAVLPGARNLVVIPFALDHVRGALVLETAAGRWSRRIERRLVSTAEQATAYAAVALERAVLTEQIRAAAQTDGLTRLANRRRFDEALVAELRRARETGADLALALVDIDHFKRLNDTHGHLTGDEVLRQVAKAIRAGCGEPHLVARYGGEEFAVILVGADPAAALAAAERIRSGIASLEAVVHVTASIGVASCPAHGDTPAELIAAADAALYAAKAGGRDQVVAATRATPDLPSNPSTPAGLPR